MKKVRLIQEIAVLLALGGTIASCGGGGGSSSNTLSTPPVSTPPVTPAVMPSILCPQSSNPYVLNVCQGTDYNNEPVVTVYIDGQPVDLLVDTGASGLIVNQTAVNIPPSDYSGYSYTAVFGDGSSATGIIASATVCLNPSSTVTCVVMPIGVNTSGNAFPTLNEAQGDFGLDSGLNIMDWGYNSTGNWIAGASYPYYLEHDNPSIDSYTLSFNSLTGGFYEVASATVPVGTVVFGTYNGNSQTLISYTTSQYGLGFPSTTVYFNGSFTNTAIFDTGSTANFISTQALEAGIPGFSPSQDEGQCAPYYGASYTSLVNGGFMFSYSIQQNNSQTYTTSFTTEPDVNFCSTNQAFNLITGMTIDAGNYQTAGFEDFGLPEMLRHTYTWVLYPSGNTYQGFVQYISINP